MKILIVDDEPLALARLYRLLTSLDHNDITQASSAEEALELSAQKKFDLAFLDISMSGMNGIELGYALRYHHEEMRIIYQSAYDNHALAAFDVGAVDYLLKPYTVEQLERSLERISVKTPPKELRLITKAGETHYLLSPEDIYYVQADLSEVIFRSREGFSYYPKKISDVEKMLEPYSFLRVHRSYLVNLNKIREMNTIEQSRISFLFEGIKESVESSKDGAKHFRHLFK
ncbi:LytTR family DNA-binding domain-containing protein [Sulfuricurvum sp.]|uniref:LytR/AlgR family response regulator transcription factor n=1 Tax=Sulfuricurvum sp. TaxID=2025608 RepID=UPI0026163DE2|nr:LytTR family DNA-binding domain-containing protein [Sulfuricurvum sp.]MDD2780764.1 LytTR family DNA-binding domain-containing protein [Sulfuricurvum sp.]